MANYEINMDKKEAHLLPHFCRSGESGSSSSSSSNASSEEESSDNEEYSRQRFSSNERNSLAREDSMRSRRSNMPRRSKKIKQSKWSTYWNRYKRFLQSPRVHFVYDATFYLIFLLFFSYIILCEFGFYEVIEETTEIAPVTDAIDLTDNNDYTTTFPPELYSTTTIVTAENFSYLLRDFATSSSSFTTSSPGLATTSFKLNSNTSYKVKKSVVHRKSGGGGSRRSPTLNSTASTVTTGDVQKITTEERRIRLPSWMEYLLIYWMFAFMAEEARQVRTLEFVRSLETH